MDNIYFQYEGAAQMKGELSSVDLRVLVRELRAALSGLRLDKAYQVGGRELVFKFYGRGSVDVVVAPNFMCLTRFKRQTPKMPSSFSMQLRKNLAGSQVIDVRQHGFDRIVEFEFEGKIVVVELFSKGNLILCDKGYKILGLLDWQKWKDRTLGVGQTYSYPPAVVDPYSIGFDEFKNLMEESGKKAASTLATRLSLGGYYAELVCKNAHVDAKAGYGEYSVEGLWESFKSFLDEVDGEVRARATGDNVTPFGGEGTEFTTYNEAVDEYFSKMQASDELHEAETVADDKRKKYVEIHVRQVKALDDARRMSLEGKAVGDLLYQRMDEMKEVLDYVRKERRNGVGDGEILAGLKKWDFVKGLKGYELTLEL